MTLDDLKKKLNKLSGEDQIGVIFYCERCGARYSCNPSDYFLHSGDHEFECCGYPLALVRKRTLMDAV